MTDKLCLWCKHFWLNLGEPDYSELTPGSDFDMACNKQHWTFRGTRYQGEHDFRRLILTAQNCEDYDFNQDLVHIK